MEVVEKDIRDTDSINQDVSSSNHTLDNNDDNNNDNIKKKHWWAKKTDTSFNPKDYSKTKKNIIILIVALASGISPVSSSIYYPAIVDMQKYFNTTDTMLNASLSVFTFFTAFFPLIWATFGDRYGRRQIYIISFFITCIGNICCAVSINIEMFIVFRAFSAAGSCSAMALGAGTISDIYETHERGRAYAYYTCGPLLGPMLGPILGGFLNQGLGWRSIFYFIAIFNFLIWVAIIFGLPETWRSPVSKIDSQNSTFESDLEAKEECSNKNKKTKFINPIGALKLLAYPNIALCVTFIGSIFFSFYLNMTNFTRTYTLTYGFDSGLVGVCYLPSAIGFMIGGMFGGRMSDRRYNSRATIAKENNQPVHPEMRLGGPLFYSGIIFQMFAFAAYGWCIQEELHFAYGLVFQFIIGACLMYPNIILNAYLIDCFRDKGASVAACNNFIRYMLAGIGALVSSDLLRVLGNGFLFTLCGCLVFVCSGAVVLVIHREGKWVKK